MASFNFVRREIIFNKLQFVPKENSCLLHQPCLLDCRSQCSVMKEVKLLEMGRKVLVAKSLKVHLYQKLFHGILYDEDDPTSKA